MHLRPWIVFLLALAFLTACASQADPLVAHQGLEIDALTVTAAQAGGVAGVFMRIKNTSPQAEWLVGVESPAAEMAQLHQTKLENGIMTMVPVDSIVIPAGETLELEHGGYHIMLINLSQDLRAGQTITLTLKFKTAGEVLVPIPATAP